MAPGPGRPAPRRPAAQRLVGLLTTIAATIRERGQVRRRLAAPAAGRTLSAIVLDTLQRCPWAISVLVQRDHVMIVFTDPRGSSRRPEPLRDRGWRFLDGKVVTAEV